MPTDLEFRHIIRNFTSENRFNAYNPIKHIQLKHFKTFNTTMKKIIATLALLATFMSMNAQDIANIEVTQSWNYVYDSSGKKICTISRSQGELVGYSYSFFVLKSGSWYYFYSPTGKKFNTLSVSYVGEIISVAGNTFTSRNGNWIYTWSKEGKKINTRSAR